MKKTALFSISLAFISIIMISSCSKNSLDQPGFPGFRCSLGGAEYIADSASYIKYLGTTIYVYTGTTQRFNFNLVRADTVGNFNLDSSGTANSVYYTDGITRYQSIAGSVNISQYYNDSLKVISGTFSFTGRVPGSSGNTLVVTDGYFNNIPRR
jgi:hypothetical protein